MNKPNAVKGLQKSLQALGSGPIIVDGKFGPQTLGLLAAVDSKCLLHEFRARQSIYSVDAMPCRFLRQLKTLGVNISEDRRGIALKYALDWLRRVMA